MHIRRIKTLALTTCTIFAITAVADYSSPTGYDFGTVASAQAGNGNGNGNGGGNGGGRGGGGNAGGNGKGGGAAGNNGNGHGIGGGNGKSGGLLGAITARSKSPSSRGKDKSLFGNLGLGFGRDKTKTASTGKRSTKAPAANTKARAAKVDLAAVPVPSLKPAKEKNFRAKLAGLNSLNRNYNAYMNANDPRMAAVRSYVMASIEYDKAAATLEDTLADLGIAKDAFAGAVASLYDGLTTFDGFSPDEPDIAGLEGRLTDLESLDPSTLTEAEAAAVQSEIDAINSALSGTEAASLRDVQDVADEAQAAVDELADQVTDEALTEALLDAANKNRVEEYGVENYVDDQMLDWAKDVLGVDEAYGKIDQVREALDEAEAETAGTETPADEEIES